MPDRWEAGMTGFCNGIAYRVVQGYKHPRDLRLDLKINGEWVAVDMELGMLMADFMFYNEDNMPQYSRQNGKEGGFRYLNALWQAATGDGWEAEARRLEEEKRAKRRRLRDQRQRGSLPAA